MKTWMLTLSCRHSPPSFFCKPREHRPTPDYHVSGSKNTFNTASYDGVPLLAQWVERRSNHMLAV